MNRNTYQSNRAYDKPRSYNYNNSSNSPVSINGRSPDKDKIKSYNRNNSPYENNSNNTHSNNNETHTIYTDKLSNGNINESIEHIRVDALKEISHLQLLNMNKLEYINNIKYQVIQQQNDFIKTINNHDIAIKDTNDLINLHLVNLKNITSGGSIKTLDVKSSTSPTIHKISSNLTTNQSTNLSTNLSINLIATLNNFKEICNDFIYLHNKLYKYLYNDYKKELSTLDQSYNHVVDTINNFKTSHNNNDSSANSHIKSGSNNNNNSKRVNIRKTYSLDSLKAMNNNNNYDEMNKQSPNKLSAFPTTTQNNTKSSSNYTFDYLVNNPSNRPTSSPSSHQSIGSPAMSQRSNYSNYSNKQNDSTYQSKVNYNNTSSNRYNPKIQTPYGKPNDRSYFQSSNSHNNKSNGQNNYKSKSNYDNVSNASFNSNQSKSSNKRLYNDKYSHYTNDHNKSTTSYYNHNNGNNRGKKQY